MNTNFLDSVTNFLKKRTFELLGLILVLSSVALAIAFTTYSPEDPSFIYGDRTLRSRIFLGFMVAALQIFYYRVLAWLLFCYYLIFYFGD